MFTMHLLATQCSFCLSYVSVCLPCIPSPVLTYWFFDDMAMFFAITSPVLVWGGFLIAQDDLSYTPGLRIICVLGHLPPKSQMWLLQTQTSLMFIGTPLSVSSVSSFGSCGLRIAGLLTGADSVSGCTWQDGMPVSKSNFCDDDTF